MNINRLHSVLQAYLTKADLGKEKTERILGDAHRFIEDIKGMFPKAGAELAFSFLAEQGRRIVRLQMGRVSANRRLETA